MSDCAAEGHRLDVVLEDGTSATLPGVCRCGLRRRNVPREDAEFAAAVDRYIAATLPAMIGRLHATRSET